MHSVDSFTKKIRQRAYEIFVQYVDGFDKVSYRSMCNILRPMTDYDILCVCEKIYKYLQQTLDKKIEFSCIKYDCEPKYANGLDNNQEKLKAQKKYNDIYAIISKPFVRQDTDKSFFKQLDTIQQQRLSKSDRLAAQGKNLFGFYPQQVSNDAILYAKEHKNKKKVFHRKQPQPFGHFVLKGKQIYLVVY